MKTQTIYRYDIPTIGLNHIRTYQNCQILSAGIDPRGTLSVWIMVDTSEEMDNDLKIFVAGTGWDFMPGLEQPVFINTVKQEQYMWHLFFDGTQATTFN